MATWFYKQGNRAIGPIDESTMRDWIRQGSIAPSQLVRPDDTDEWRSADRAFSDLMDPSRAPDLLAGIAKAYFECDGLCFVPVFDAVAGKCRVNLYYQNRYERECRGEILLEARPGFWPGQGIMMPLAISVECSGGEFGVVRQLCAIPKDLQGKNATFDTSGTATYPSGRGSMIRFHRGIGVFEPEPKAVTVFRILSALGGLIMLRKEARLACLLPTGVAETINELYPPHKETLWSLPEKPQGNPSPCGNDQV